MDDNFNRPDNDDPGSKWTEVVTDADIASYVLKLDGYEAMVVTKDGVASFGIQVYMTDAAGTGIIEDIVYMVIFHYTDSLNYSWATFVTSSTPTPSTTLSVGSVSGGSSTTAATSTIQDVSAGTDPVKMDICYNKTGAYVVTEDPPIHDLYACIPPGTGDNLAGLRNPNVSGNPIYFDDWSWVRHVVATDIKDKAACVACTCDCWHYCVPKELILTVTVQSGVCSCWDGVTADLDYLYDGSEFTWVGTLTLPAPFDDCANPVDQDSPLILFCGGDDGLETDWQNWRLCFDDSLSASNCYGDLLGCASETASEIAPQSGSCSAFSLSFNDGQCESEGGECNFTMTITER